MNSALFALANRTNFQSSIFPTGPYNPVVLPEVPTAVHQLLRLDDADYFLVGPLAALRSHAELLENLGPDDTTFDLTRYQRPADVLSVPLLADSKGPVSVRRVPTRFPLSFTITVSYVDGTHVVVSSAAVSTIVPVTVTPGVRLDLTWPAWTGITGGIDISGSNYGPNWSMNVQHVPISYPYKAVAKVLTESRDTNTLLLQTGLMSHYFQAKTGFERVATVACALCLSNPSFSWPTFR